VNIPSKFLRDHADVWDTPGWEWKDDFIIDDVYYFHGEGTGGVHPAFNSMLKQLMSVVQGHVHGAGGVKWRANPQRRIFGLDTGCGVDDSSYAFAYAKQQKLRSILSAAVILDGVPQHIIMPCGPGEAFHRSNFGTDSFGGFDHDEVSDRPVFARVRASADSIGHIGVRRAKCSRKGSPAAKRRRNRKG
jgi:hypothetical protein